MRVMKMGAFNNGRKYKRLMSVSVCRDASTSWGSARGIAIYFTKRKLPQARRIAPFPRDKCAARWLKYFKENRSSRLSISFEESCKSILTAGRASYWTKNSNSSISGERKREYGDSELQCLHTLCILGLANRD